MKTVSYQARRHQKTVQRKTMALRALRRFEKAALAPHELTRHRAEMRYYEAKRSSWFTSFRGASPMRWALNVLFKMLADRAEAKKNAR